MPLGSAFCLTIHSAYRLWGLCTWWGFNSQQTNQEQQPATANQQQPPPWPWDPQRCAVATLR
eukprot:575981-Amphidinium_carterae.1